MINNKTIRQYAILNKCIKSGTSTSYKKRTASGSIASFDTNVVKPLDSAVFNFTPTQAAGTPTPSNPIAIYGHTGLNVVKCGANFWDEEYLNGYYSNTGAYTYNAGQLCTKNKIDVIPNTTYRLVLANLTGNQGQAICFYEKDGTFISRTLNVYEFTTPANCYQINVNFGSNYGGTYNNDISINYPSTDMTYHAYTATTYPISWTDTVYGGSVDTISGTVVSDYGYLVLDGSEDWDLYTPQYGFALSISGMKKGSAMTGYSNFLPTITSSANFGIRFGGALVNDIIYCCRIIGNIEGVTDLESWKTYLSTNNLIICYPLEVPETLAVEPQTINTLEGINNIYHDIDGTTDITYLYEVQKTESGILKWLPIFYPSGKGVNHNGSTF